MSNLRPFSCMHCGAGLPPPAMGTLVVTCIYCNKAFSVQAPAPPTAPAAPMPPPVQHFRGYDPGLYMQQAAAYQNQARSMYVYYMIGVGALIGLSMVGSMVAQCNAHSGTPAATSTPAEAPTGGKQNVPKKGKAAYAAGERVFIYWGASWYPGTILSVERDQTYKVRYEGWSTAFDEVVGLNRLRPR
jgi:hypothetical protein